MKKLKALALFTVAAGAAGFYALNNLAHEALISRNFTVPESFSKKLSEVGENEFEEKGKENYEWLKAQSIEEFTRINDRGLKLQGYLLRPEKESDVYVFGSHGYRSDGMGEWCHYAKHYVEDLGFNMFFVDHQSAGKSEGEYIGFASYESQDGLKWLDFMTETFGSDIKIILHGISMGSTTVMLMTGSDKLPSNVKFTVADCGFTSALDEFNYKLENLNFPKFPLVPVVSAINRRKVGYDFGKDTNALEAVKKAKTPMLFIHGGNDKFVPTYMCYLLHHTCESEYKDILIVDGADHAQSYMVDPKSYENKINEFVEKFI